MSGWNALKQAGLFAAMVMILAAGPARAEWLRAESPHFIVYGDTSEGRLREYINKVERFDSVLRLWFPIPADNEKPKLEIFLARGLDDLKQINPDIRSGIGGFYSAGDDRVFAVVDLDRSEGDHTLFHEYGHHFMLAYMTGAYPGWFIEGFAEFFATADLSPGRIRVGLESPGRMVSLRQGANSWVPMEAVLGSRSAQLRPGQGAGYYAQSWALTSYFLSTPERRELLKRYLGAVMDGAEPVAALEGTVGRTPAQLQNDVRLYLTRISFATLRQDFPPVEVSINRMPRSARELVWLDLRLDRTSGDADHAELLTRIRGIAANYPDDRLAAVVLAKAEMHAENWSAAQAALTPLIGEGSGDAEALRLAAVARMKRGDAEGIPEVDRAALYREARSLLARANRAAPTDFRVYMALADTREGQPGYPNDNDLNILLAAAEYAPQVAGTRFRAAQALVHQEIYLQAIELLAPVANNPHGGAGMQPVRALLAEARENAGLAPADMAAPEVEDAPEEEAPPADD